MTLTEIEEQWSVDSDIDITSSMDYEIGRTSKLHSKYHRELNQSRAKLLQEKNKLAQMLKDKYEAFVLPSRKLTLAEQQASPIGKWEKGAFKDIFLPSEPEFQKQTTAVELADMKVKFLEQIIRQLNSFPNVFREINIAKKFMNGD